MVDEDGYPGDEDAAGGQIDKPPKHRQCALGERHEGEEHEYRLDDDTDVRDAPGGGAEEDLRGLAFEGEGVEDAGS